MEIEMSAVDLLRTSFELVVVIALIVGFVFEKRIVEFEKRIADFIKTFVKDRKATKNAVLEETNKHS